MPLLSTKTTQPLVQFFPPKNPKGIELVVHRTCFVADLVRDLKEPGIEYWVEDGNVIECYSNDRMDVLCNGTYSNSRGRGWSQSECRRVRAALPQQGHIRIPFDAAREEIS